MKEDLRHILSDNLIRISVVSSCILIMLQILLSIFFIPRFPPLIPLLNSQPWGGDRLFPPSSALIIPISFIIIFLVNNLASAIFYKKNMLAARILSFNSFLFILLGILAYIQIIFLVF